MLKWILMFLLICGPVYGQCVDGVCMVNKYEDVNLFWHADGTIEVKRNKEFVFVCKSESSYSRTVMAYLYADIEILDDVMMVYRDGVLLKTFKISEVIYVGSD